LRRSERHSEPVVQPPSWPLARPPRPTVSPRLTILTTTSGSPTVSTWLSWRRNSNACVSVYFVCSHTQYILQHSNSTVSLNYIYCFTPKKSIQKRSWNSFLHAWYFLSTYIHAYLYLSIENTRSLIPATCISYINFAINLKSRVDF
jgi:hypothetical protein